MLIVRVETKHKFLKTNAGGLNSPAFYFAISRLRASATYPELEVACTLDYSTTNLIHRFGRPDETEVITPMPAFFGGDRFTYNGFDFVIAPMSQRFF